MLLLNECVFFYLIFYGFHYVFLLSICILELFGIVMHSSFEHGNRFRVWCCC